GRRLPAQRAELRTPEDEGHADVVIIEGAKGNAAPRAEQLYLVRMVGEHQITGARGVKAVAEAAEPLAAAGAFAVRGAVGGHAGRLERGAGSGPARVHRVDAVAAELLMAEIEERVNVALD